MPAACHAPERADTTAERGSLDEVRLFDAMERRAGLLLAAGAVVAAALVALELLALGSVHGLLQVVVTVGLVLVGYVVLRLIVVRTMGSAIGAARREASVSRRMLQAVERFAEEPAGMRGTLEALGTAAAEAGLEVYMWDGADRALHAPTTGERHVLTAAAARRLQDAVAARVAIRVTDAGVSGMLPAELACRETGEALALAPLWSGDEFLGLVLRRERARHADRRPEDMALVASFAALGSVAVSKALVVDRERQRARDNELLLRSVHAAAEHHERDRLADHAAQAAQALDAQRCGIFALESGRLRLAGSCGIARGAMGLAGSLRVRSALVDAVRGTDHAPVNMRLDDLDEPSRTVLERLGFSGSVLVHALRDGAGVVGVLVADCRPDRQMTAGTRSLVLALGRHAAMAIERTRMTRSIRKRSRHLACTPKLARSLTGQRDPHDVARIAARELHDGFGYGHVEVALCNGAGSEVELVASEGAGSAPDRRVLMDDVYRECIRSGRPYVSVSGDDDELAPGEDRVARTRGCIVVPVEGRERTVLGAVAVHEVDPDMLGEDDLHMLETIADQLGGTLEQAGLFAHLERSYFETVEALATALEAKDAYTLDHSRSITDMSADVGRRLGMREDEVRDLRLGALLHDIGKIGVPSTILGKPGPLDDAEFEVMKDHTIIGEQIIAPVEFLQGVRPLVLHEHERWDGAGYPHGLAGEDIPLGARIIFVCDSWHAMTSDRPYRRALPGTEALRRLRENAGSQFDPDVVEAFEQLVRDGGAGGDAAVAVTDVATAPADGAVVLASSG